MRKSEAKEFKETLRSIGSKATPSRLAVLKILKKAKRPLSAQAIIDIMKEDINQATIYRILKNFQKSHLIRPVDFRHNHAHYELNEGKDKKHHHHLICIKCGQSEDIAYCDVEIVEEMVIRRSKIFQELTEHSLEFYGICNKCFKKIKSY